MNKETFNTIMECLDLYEQFFEKMGETPEPHLVKRIEKAKKELDIIYLKEIIN